MVVGAVLDNRGFPLFCEMWPGNTTDVKSLLPVADRLKKRFGVEKICVVADRGMISQGTIEQMEAKGFWYILGVRMRKVNAVKKGKHSSSPKIANSILYKPFLINSLFYLGFHIMDLLSI
jgi:transposase